MGESIAPGPAEGQHEKKTKGGAAEMGRMGDFWQPAEDDLQGLKAAGNRSEDPETHRDGQDEKQVGDDARARSDGACGGNEGKDRSAGSDDAIVETSILVEEKPDHCGGHCAPEIEHEIPPVAEIFLEGGTEADERDHIGDDVQPKEVRVTKHIDGMGPCVGENRPVMVLGESAGAEGERVTDQVGAFKMVDSELKEKYRDGRADERPCHPRDRSYPRVEGIGVDVLFVHESGRPFKLVQVGTVVDVELRGEQLENRIDPTCRVLLSSLQLPDKRAGDSSLTGGLGIISSGRQNNHDERDIMISTIQGLAAFVDLTGYAKLSGRKTDEEIFHLLSDYYELVGDVITPAHGKVIKFMGDAALMLFPEEHVDVGVRALLDLQKRGDSFLVGRGAACRQHIRAHFGPICYGLIGTRNDKRPDMLGSTVNTMFLLKTASAFALTPEVFRKLAPDTRKLFKKHTPPVVYISISEPHRD